MTNPAIPVILVDGSSYLFRAFHALPPLTTSSGRQTGAVKGVVAMLRTLRNTYPESPVAVVFDAKGATFRHDLYAAYKANRPPMPEELREQIAPIHDCVRAMGFPLLCVTGVEADDVIGTLAAQATRAGRQCLVSTGDKDMAQLVSAQVTLINTMKNETLDVAGVTQKYGFGPERMIDYLALMGDKVDNIPGVPGVGEKTAVALIQGLGGLDDIYARLDEVANLSFRGAKTMAVKLLANKEQAYLSYRLATIKLDVALDVGFEDIRMGAADNDRLLALFTELQFRSWQQELVAGGHAAAAPQVEPASEQTISMQPTAPVLDEQDYQVITELSEVDAVVSCISASGQMAYLPVLAKAHYLHPEWAGIALAAGSGQGWYLVLRANEQEVLPRAELFAKLAPLFASHEIVKTGYDIKADHHWFDALGLQTARLAYDVQVMAFVYDATIKREASLSAHFSQLSIDNLIIRYLQQSPQTIEAFLGKAGKRQLSVTAVDAQDMGRWWAQRAAYLLRLSAWLEQGLAQRSVAHVYREIEQPLSSVLARTEHYGVLLDTKMLGDLSDQLKERLANIEQQAHEAAGLVFNIDSPKQLADVLFNRLALPVISKTAGGTPSTNEEVLTELARDHELPRLILQSRHLRKLVGTYTDPLPMQVIAHADEARLHTTYNQTGAQTGRLNSNDPNLQNIPIRTAEGRAIRKAFIAPAGYRLVAADYSQIELRIMTHLSKDANLIAAFKEGKDIHRSTAADVMSIAEDQVTNEQRRAAKAINFGLIYGMSAFGLAKQLGISRSEAKNYVDAYFARYPGVHRYMEETRVEAAENGYVSTVFGRRLYLPAIKSGNQIARKAAERTAINAPMQGTAADIIKMAMVDVGNWLRDSALEARMIMQVHDELVFEVHNSAVEALIEGVKFRMQNCVNLDVPLVVDVGVGDSWEAAH